MDKKCSDVRSTLANTIDDRKLDLFRVFSYLIYYKSYLFKHNMIFMCVYTYITDTLAQVGAHI